jgi:hypothetical protein
MPGRALDLLTLVLIAALHGILWYAVDDGLNDSILSKRGCAGKEGTYVILSLEKRAMHLQTLFWKNGTTTWSYWGTRGRGESIGFLVPASPTIKSECARTHGCTAWSPDDRQKGSVVGLVTSYLFSVFYMALLFNSTGIDVLRSVSEYLSVIVTYLSVCNVVFLLIGFRHNFFSRSMNSVIVGCLADSLIFLSCDRTVDTHRACDAASLTSSMSFALAFLVADGYLRSTFLFGALSFILSVVVRRLLCRSLTLYDHVSFCNYAEPRREHVTLLTIAAIPVVVACAGIFLSSNTREAALIDLSDGVPRESEVYRMLRSPTAVRQPLFVSHSNQGEDSIVQTARLLHLRREHCPSCTMTSSPNVTVILFSMEAPLALERNTFRILSRLRASMKAPSCMSCLLCDLHFTSQALLRVTMYTNICTTLCLFVYLLSREPPRRSLFISFLFAAIQPSCAVALNYWYTKTLLTHVMVLTIIPGLGVDYFVHTFGCHGRLRNIFHCVMTSCISYLSLIASAYDGIRNVGVAFVFCTLCYFGVATVARGVVDKSDL